MKKRIKKTEWMLVLASLLSAASFLYVNGGIGHAVDLSDRQGLFQESKEGPSVVLPDTERIKKLIQIVQRWMPQQRI